MLFLIRGISGSGKSTLARKLSEMLNCMYYEADQYFVDNRGNYNFDASKLHNAHQFCQNAVERRLLLGENVIVSNTFTTLKEIEPYMILIKENETKVMIFEMNGEYQNIHNVPSDVLDRQKKRFQNIPKDWYDDLIIEIATIGKNC